MLTHLQIENFAIIETLSLELHAGMTVVTGETGAGKSIMIDALTLLFGARANNKFIRHGEKACSVSGTFQISHLSTLQAWLNEQCLSEEQSDECLVRRVITQDGRSRAFVNGHVVALNQLKTLANHLADIHGQHEYQSLFKQDKQRTIVDVFGKHAALLNEIKDSFSQWQTTQRAIAKLNNQQQNKASRIDLLAFQLSELSELDLVAGEVENLHIELKALSQVDNHVALYQQILDLLSNQDHNAHAQINQAIQLLNRQHSNNSTVQAINELLQLANIQLQEANDCLKQLLSSLQADPERLLSIENRLQRIHNIARKHRVNAEELPQLAQQLQLELDTLNDSEQRLHQLQTELDNLSQRYLASAHKLSQKRRTVSQRLAKQVTAHMHNLGMPNGQFHIECQTKEEQMSAQGIDSIIFMVNTNPGQSLAPLSDIASGGELSRISLAIEVVIAQHYRTPIVVLDEVDIGIGGQTASIVGQLLHDLSLSTQVLCITHQPQVAAQSDHHLQVHKQTDGKTTHMAVAYLTPGERVQEIARMLGGKRISQQTLAHAQELLDY